MVRDDFIPKILNFDNENVRPEILQAIKKYVENPDFDYDKVCYGFCLEKKEINNVPLGQQS